MRKNSKTYIRYLRAVLGTGLRLAYDALEPLRLDLERGLRWEQDETVRAVEIKDDLFTVALEVGNQLKRFLEPGFGRKIDLPSGTITVSPGRLSAAERRRLEEAFKEIVLALKGMEKIDVGGTMHKLSWPLRRPSLGHEAYFLRGMQNAAGETVEGGLEVQMMRLRAAWSRMFYATQSPSVKKIKLTARQTVNYLNPMTNIAEVVQQQARDLANETAKYVEVIGSDQELLFVAQPPSATKKIEAVMAGKRARGQAETSVRPSHKRSPSQALQLGQATPAQLERVTAILAGSPGMSLEDAAQSAGLTVLPVTMTPNAPSNAELLAQYYDMELFEDLWELPLG